MGSKPDFRQLKERKDVKGLIRALEHEDSRVRSDAAKALGEFGDASLVPLLTHAMSRMHTDSALSAAVRALRNIGEPAVVPLIEALGSKSETAASGVARALGEIGDRRAVEPLARLVRERREHFVRRTAATALGKLGPEAADAVGPALHDENLLVRQEAVKALEEMGGERATAILVEGLQYYEENQDNVALIRQAIRKLQSGTTEEMRGECPVCGTSLTSWDDTMVVCHFCGANLRIESGRLTEYISHEVTESPTERVVIHMNRGGSVAWPNCCSLCLGPVSASDYRDISASFVLSSSAVAGRMERHVLQFAGRVPYCKACHGRVKKLFGHRDQEAVSAEIAPVGRLGTNVRLTFKFRNGQYAQMFRQANNKLIRAGKLIDR